MQPVPLRTSFGDKLFSDACVTSDASITLKSLQWIQMLAKMLSSDFKKLINVCTLSVSVFHSRDGFCSLSSPFLL